MPIHQIVQSCLRRDTSKSENGKSVSIDRGPGEAIFFIDSDSDAFRKAVGLVDKQCCDVVVFYKKKSRKSLLVLVELSGKGKRATDSANQIRSTFLALKQVLESYFDRDQFVWKALVVGSDNAVPQQKQNLCNELSKKFGITVKFCSEKAANLRDYLPK